MIPIHLIILSRLANAVGTNGLLQQSSSWRSLQQPGHTDAKYVDRDCGFGENTIKEEPYIVSIQLQSPVQDAWWHICTGVQVTESLVLTTASCVWSLNTENQLNGTQTPKILAAISPNCRHHDGQGQFEVKNFLIHPDYNQSTDLQPIQINDLAFLKIDVSNVIRPKLDNNVYIELDYDVDWNNTIGQDFSIISYGQKNQSDSAKKFPDEYYVNILPHDKDKVQFLSDKNCKQKINEYANATEEMLPSETFLCGVMVTGDLCFSDSGAPVFRNDTIGDSDTVDTLLGLLYWKPYQVPCNQENSSHPLLFTNISYYSEWIVDMILQYEPDACTSLSPMLPPHTCNSSSELGNRQKINGEHKIIILSISLGVGFWVAITIVLVVLWRRCVKKFKEEPYESGAGNLSAGEMGELSQIIIGEMEESNQGFSQPFNWWGDIRIPTGVTEIPLTDLKEVRPLGAGGFALVYEVKFNDDARDKYADLCDKQLAVKVVYKEYIQIKHQVEAIMQEINVMKDLDNQYVVQLIGASLQIRPSIVMELVPWGSLENLLYSDGFRSHQTSLEWKLKLILNISKGIQYLHFKGITHQDLKPPNILIKDKHEAIVKISDFGLAKMTVGSSKFTRTCVGTIQYMAPEVCQGCQRVTNKVDIWALGVIMQEIIRGVRPWNTQNEQYIFNRLSQFKEPPDNGKLPNKDCSQKLLTLIKRCWRKASRRPSANEVVNTIDAILHQDSAFIKSVEPKQSQP